MKIGVFLKQVPDTEALIKLAADQKSIDESGIKWIVNPFDEYAVEEAIQLKENIGGEVVVICVGPYRSMEAIRSALAVGADRGILVNSGGIEPDSFLTSKILSEVIKEEMFDIIFAGKKAVDDECFQVVQMTAEHLNWPVVPVIERFVFSNGKAFVQRPMDAGEKDILEVELPAIFGCEKDLNKPRYASLQSIVNAKMKQVATKTADEIIGGEAGIVELVKYTLPPERRAGKIVDGAPNEVAEKLVEFLEKEAKVL